MRIILLIVSIYCTIACSQSPYMCTAVIGGVQYASKNAVSKRAAKQAAGTLLWLLSVGTCTLHFSL